MGVNLRTLNFKRECPILFSLSTINVTKKSSLTSTKSKKNGPLSKIRKRKKFFY